MYKYDHKKDFFIRNDRIRESDLQDSEKFPDWVMVLDEDDFHNSGVYDKFVEIYGSRVAELFLDWVKSPEYGKSSYKIWIPSGDPEKALISSKEGISASLFLNGQLTTQGGISGMILSPRYLKNNLVKVRSDLDNNDVLFHGETSLLGHVNPDSEVEFFQDPDGNIIDDTI